MTEAVMNGMLFAPMVALALTQAPAHEPRPESVAILKEATEVLDDLGTLYLKRLPPALLADAKAVAVIPHTVKVGFVVGGRLGHGVVLVRGDDGKWGDPVFVRLTGVSAGFQAGVESADVVLVFRTKKNVDRLLSGKEKLTLGADAAVAAGPVGREAAAGTDGQLEAEVYSYSRARGLFAGVSLEGAVIAYDRMANREFVGETEPEAGRAVDRLRGKLIELADQKPLKP
jgi:lipid-binding SYLF domain-containing protein